MFQCKPLKMRFSTEVYVPATPLALTRPVGFCGRNLSQNHRIFRGKDHLVPTPPTRPGCSGHLFSQGSMSQGHKTLYPCPSQNFCVIILFVLLHQGPFQTLGHPLGHQLLTKHGENQRAELSLIGNIYSCVPPDVQIFSVIVTYKYILCHMYLGRGG